MPRRFVRTKTPRNFCVNYLLMYRKRHTETLIRHYFFQLTEGCKKEGCRNGECATGSGRPLNRDQAAAKAVELARGRGREGLCVPLDGVLSKTSSTASLTSSNASIGKTPSSISDVSSTADHLPEPSVASPNQTPEPMETAEAADISIQSATSTDSVGSTGNPLILIHSRASTGDTPPVSRRHMPDPSGISASSSSESGMSGPTGLTTTTSASAVSVSLSTSEETTSDSLSNISMDLSSTDSHSSNSKVKKSDPFGRSTTRLCVY